MVPDCIPYLTSWCDCHSTLIKMGGSYNRTSSLGTKCNQWWLVFVFSKGGVRKVNNVRQWTIFCTFFWKFILILKQLIFTEPMWPQICSENELFLIMAFKMFHLCSTKSSASNAESFCHRTKSRRPWGYSSNGSSGAPRQKTQGRWRCSKIGEVEILPPKICLKLFEWSLHLQAFKISYFYRHSQQCLAAKYLVAYEAKSANRYSHIYIR